MYEPIPSCLQKGSKFFKNFPRRLVLENIRKMILPLAILFASVLAKHMNSEFEIQIRSGSLTPASRTKLKEISADSQTLQYTDDIKLIFQEARSSLHKYDIHRHPHILNLINVVEDECILWFREIIAKEHENCVKNRRKQNMKLCRKKMFNGSDHF